VSGLRACLEFLAVARFDGRRNRRSSPLASLASVPLACKTVALSRRETKLPKPNSHRRFSSSRPSPRLPISSFFLIPPFFAPLPSFPVPIRHFPVVASTGERTGASSERLLRSLYRNVAALCSSLQTLVSRSPLLSILRLPRRIPRPRLFSRLYYTYELSTPIRGLQSHTRRASIQQLPLDLQQRGPRSTLFHPHRERLAPLMLSLQ